MNLTQVEKSLDYILHHLENEQLWFLTWVQGPTRIKVDSVVPIGIMNLNEVWNKINSPNTILMKLESSDNQPKQEAPNADTRSNTAGKESW